MSRKKLIVTSIILVLILAIGGILAYFTDVETKTNTFAMGKVDIEVTETDWPVGEDEKVTDVVPGTTVPKNPQVKNKGTTPVYAFVTVSIPYENVVVGNNAKTDAELFTTNYDASNSEWVEIGTATKDTTNKTFTHVYAYVGNATGDSTNKVKALEGNQTTSAVFTTVTFADVKEIDGDASAIQGKDLNVIVKGYGIQTTEIGNSTVPATVWGLVQSANPNN